MGVIANQMPQRTVLFVNYVSDDLKIFDLPDNFDIQNTVSRFRLGEPAHNLIRKKVMMKMENINSVGHISFYRGNGKDVLEYSEKSPQIFLDSQRILTREQLENILDRTHKIRKINRWTPFFDLMVPNGEELCIPNEGQFSEKFIRDSLLENKESERFYANMSYWSAFQTVQKDDLILSSYQFMRSIN